MPDSISPFDGPLTLISVFNIVYFPLNIFRRSASPEGEKYFETLKKKHGSCFGFHGSDVENWHSILRNGIRNMSGTALQINGAAYGKVKCFQKNDLFWLSLP